MPQDGSESSTGTHTVKPSRVKTPKQKLFEIDFSVVVFVGLTNNFGAHDVTALGQAMKIMAQVQSSFPAPLAAPGAWTISVPHNARSLRSRQGSKQALTVDFVIFDTHPSGIITHCLGLGHLLLRAPPDLGFGTSARHVQMQASEGLENWVAPPGRKKAPAGVS